MNSPLRLYSFINRLTKTSTKQIINLTKVSSIDLQKKKIIFNMSHEKESIFGGFIIFSGGNTVRYKINFDTQEEAEREFNDVYEQINKFYSK